MLLLEWTHREKLEQPRYETVRNTSYLKFHNCLQTAAIVFLLTVSWNYVTLSLLVIFISHRTSAAGVLPAALAGAFNMYQFQRGMSIQCLPVGQAIISQYLGASLTFTWKGMVTPENAVTLDLKLEFKSSWQTQKILITTNLWRRVWTHHVKIAICL